MQKQLALKIPEGSEARELVEMVKKRRPADFWIEELTAVFTDPIISHPSGWMETIPQMIKDQVTIQRLISFARGEEGMATDAEAAAYMYPATMEFPLDHDWAQIYLYVTTKVCQMAKREVPDDIKVESLTDWQMEQLNHLKRWIYEQRLKIRKERRREERRTEKENQAVVEAAEAVQGTVQLDFFGQKEGRAKNSS